MNGPTRYEPHIRRTTGSPGGDKQSYMSCATTLYFCSFDEFANVTSVPGGRMVVRERSDRCVCEQVCSSCVYVCGQLMTQHVS